MRKLARLVLVAILLGAIPALWLTVALTPEGHRCLGGDCGCQSPRGCDMPCTGCCEGADPVKGCPPPPSLGAPEGTPDGE